MNMMRHAYLLGVNSDEEADDFESWRDELLTSLMDAYKEEGFMEYGCDQGNRGFCSPSCEYYDNPAGADINQSIMEQKRTMSSYMIDGPSFESGSDGCYLKISKGKFKIEDVILFPSSPRQAKEEIEEYNLQTTNEGSDKVIFFRVISREEFFNLLESAE
jgi:hypothetical protein